MKIRQIRGGTRLAWFAGSPGAPCVASRLTNDCASEMAAELIRLDGAPPWLHSSSGVYAGTPLPGLYAIGVAAAVSEQGLRSAEAHAHFSVSVGCQTPVWETPVRVPPIVEAVGGSVAVFAKSHGARVSYTEGDPGNHAGVDMISVEDASGLVHITPLGSGVVRFGVTAIAAAAAEGGAEDIASASSTRIFETYAMRLADDRSASQMSGDTVSSIRDSDAFTPPDFPRTFSVHQDDILTRCDVWAYVYAVDHATPGVTSFVVAGPTGVQTALFDHRVDAYGAHSFRAGSSGPWVQFSDPPDDKEIAPSAIVARLDRRNKKLRLDCVSSLGFEVLGSTAGWTDCPTLPHSWESWTWVTVDGDPHTSRLTFESCLHDPRIQRLLSTRHDVPTYPLPRGYVVQADRPYSVSDDLDMDDYSFRVDSSDLFGSDISSIVPSAGEYYMLVIATQHASGIRARSRVSLHAVVVNWIHDPQNIVRVGDDVVIQYSLVDRSHAAEYEISATIDSVGSGLVARVVDSGISLEGIAEEDGPVVLTGTVSVSVEQGFSSTFHESFEVTILNKLPIWTSPGATDVQMYASLIQEVALIAHAPRPIAYESDWIHAIDVVDDKLVLMVPTSGVYRADVKAVVDEHTSTDHEFSMRAFDRILDWTLEECISLSERRISKTANPEVTSTIRLDDLEHLHSMRIIFVADFVDTGGIGGIRVRIGDIDVVSLRAVSDQNSDMKLQVLDGGGSVVWESSSAALGRRVVSATIHSDGRAHLDHLEDDTAGEIAFQWAGETLGRPSFLVWGGASCGQVFAVPAFDANFIGGGAIRLSPPALDIDDPEAVAVLRGAPFDVRIASPDADAWLVEENTTSYVVYESGRLVGSEHPIGDRIATVRFRRVDGTTVDAIITIVSLDIHFEDVRVGRILAGREKRIPIHAFSTSPRILPEFTVDSASTGVNATVIGGTNLSVYATMPGPASFTLIARCGEVSKSLSVSFEANANSPSWPSTSATLLSSAHAQASLELFSHSDGAVSYDIVSVHPPGSAEPRIVEYAGRWWCVVHAGAQDGSIVTVSVESPHGPSEANMEIRIERSIDSQTSSDAITFDESLGASLNSSIYQAIEPWAEDMDLVFHPILNGWESPPPQHSTHDSRTAFVFVYAGKGSFKFQATSRVSVTHDLDPLVDGWGIAEIELDGTIVSNAKFISTSSLFALSVAMDDRFDRILFATDGGVSALHFGAASKAQTHSRDIPNDPPFFVTPGVSRAHVSDGIVATSINGRGLTEWAFAHADPIARISDAGVFEYNLSRIESASVYKTISSIVPGESQRFTPLGSEPISFEDAAIFYGGRGSFTFHASNRLIVTHTPNIPQSHLDAGSSARIQVDGKFVSEETIPSSAYMFAIAIVTAHGDEHVLLEFEPKPAGWSECPLRTLDRLSSDEGALARSPFFAVPDARACVCSERVFSVGLADPALLEGLAETPDCWRSVYSLALSVSKDVRPWAPQLTLSTVPWSHLGKSADPAPFLERLSLVESFSLYKSTAVCAAYEAIKYCPAGDTYGTSPVNLDNTVCVYGGTGTFTFHASANLRVDHVRSSDNVEGSWVARVVVNDTVSFECTLDEASAMFAIACVNQDGRTSVIFESSGGEGNGATVQGIPPIAEDDLSPHASYPYFEARDARGACLSDGVVVATLDDSALEEWAAFQQWSRLVYACVTTYRTTDPTICQCRVGEKAYFDVVRAPYTLGASCILLTASEGVSLIPRTLRIAFEPVEVGVHVAVVQVSCGISREIRTLRMLADDPVPVWENGRVSFHAAVPSGGEASTILAARVQGKNEQVVAYSIASVSPPDARAFITDRGGSTTLIVEDVHGQSTVWVTAFSETTGSVSDELFIARVDIDESPLLSDLAAMDRSATLASALSSLVSPVDIRVPLYNIPSQGSTSYPAVFSDDTSILYKVDGDATLDLGSLGRVVHANGHVVLETEFSDQAEYAPLEMYPGSMAVLRRLERTLSVTTYSGRIHASIPADTIASESVPTMILPTGSAMPSRVLVKRANEPELEAWFAGAKSAYRGGQ